MVMFSLTEVLLLAGIYLSVGVSSVTAAITTVNDDDPSVAYTGSWTNNDSCSGYYNNDLHWSNTNGSYAQISFTGTSIKWIGAKNTGHGNAKVYIDGNLDATVDTYASSWLKQQVLYEKTDLVSGPHTIKVEVTNTKNGNSSNYYQDIDAFQYNNESATVTPTPTPAATATSTPTGTPTPTPTGFARDPYSQMEAEGANYLYGCSGDANKLYNVRTGSYAVYAMVNFGTTGPNALEVNLATGSPGGYIDVWVDGITGSPAKRIGHLEFAGTGKWTTYLSKTCPIRGVTGTRDLYLVFGGVNIGGTYVADINWFRFTQGAAPTNTPASAPTPTPPSGMGYIIKEVNQNDPGITYSGTFTTTNNSFYNYGKDYTESSQDGGYFQYTFNGTAIRWYGDQNANYGIADVYVDGNLVDTVDSFWHQRLERRLLYEKAGLSSGSHTFKVVVRNNKNPRSAGIGLMLDYLEYEYLAAPTPGPSIGGKTLPPQVPYYGLRVKQEKNVVANGLVGLGGDLRGKLDVLVGKYMGSYNSITEQISIVCDSIEYPLDMLEMHMARRTGIFYGVQKIGDLDVHLIDFPLFETSFAPRMIRIKNTSGSTAHNVKVKCAFNGQSVYNGTALKWGNWMVAFTDPSATAPDSGALYTPQTSLPAGNVSVAGLYHYYSTVADATKLSDIRARNVTTDCETSITFWENWFNAGKNLGITDQKANDLIQNATALLKMQQGIDGGQGQTIRGYSDAYMRDSRGACLGFYATGHYEEIKKTVEFFYRHGANRGRFVNNAGFGDPGPLPTPAPDTANQSEPEVPGNYVGMVKMYYDATGDLTWLDRISNSVKYACDVQLRNAGTNYVCGWSWDETENYSGGSPGHWSLANTAQLAASLKFYIQYCNLKGYTTEANYYQDKLNNVLSAIDNRFWRSEHNVHWFEASSAGTFTDYQDVNRLGMPLIFEAQLNNNRQLLDANFSTGWVQPNGLITQQPMPGGRRNYCGHTQAYVLYGLAVNNNPNAKAVYDGIMGKIMLMSYMGTVCEVYNEIGTASCMNGQNHETNPHNMRPFESGTLIRALVRYLTGQ